MLKLLLTMEKTLTKIIYFLYLIISIFLILFYFDVKFFSMYSSLFHIISRAHVLIVHTFFGFLPLLSIYFILKKEDESKFSRINVKILLVIIVQVFIVLGLMMILIESYPNSFVLYHLCCAVVTLFLYQLSVLVHYKVNNIRVFIHFLCIISLFITGHFGEIIYKGSLPQW